jgi:low temperature requirement protein LtrA
MTNEQPPSPTQRRSRLRAVRRDGSKVRFLELFFDLVFVLAFTQCTALIVASPTWAGLARGLLVLALLWWSWGGYAWLTSVIDPEEGAVRIAMFGVMAALLVVALAVPAAFDDLGLAFAVAYGVVRAGHLALFVLASRDDPTLRHSVATLAASTAIGVGLLVAAAFLDGVPQRALWALAIAIDYGGPAIFGVAGWRLVPSHFAERYGLIIILALGESIVVIGVAARVGLDLAVGTAAVLGVALAAALWWAYFDVVALITERRLIRAPQGRVRNALARDSYSYLHLPLAAGIVLAAVGVENTIAHVDEPLRTVPAFALLGGVALYLLGHVALRLRNAHTLNLHRLLVAVGLVALVPVATLLPSLASLAGVAVVMWVMIAFETRRYGEERGRLRTHQLHPEPAPPHPPEDSSDHEAETGR